MGTYDDALDDINSDTNLDTIDFFECVTPALDLIGNVTLWSFPAAGTPGTPTACANNCDCILYSYDFNEDGRQGIGAGTAGDNQSITNFELFGIRRNVNKK